MFGRSAARAHQRWSGLFALPVVNEEWAARDIKNPARWMSIGTTEGGGKHHERPHRAPGWPELGTARWLSQISEVVDLVRVDSDCLIPLRQLIISLRTLLKS